MKSINKYKNYRTKYKRFFGIDFGKELVIHHIDLDHSNNDIDNLLLMPSELHTKYHLILNMLSQNITNKKSDGLIDFKLSNVIITDYNISYIDNIADTIYECKMWIDLKRNNYDEDFQILLFGKKVV